MSNAHRYAHTHTHTLSMPCVAEQWLITLMKNKKIHIDQGMYTLAYKRMSELAYIMTTQTLHYIKFNYPPQLHKNTQNHCQHSSSH